MTLYNANMLQKVLVPVRFNLSMYNKHSLEYGLGSYHTFMPYHHHVLQQKCRLFSVPLWAFVHVGFCSAPQIRAQCTTMCALQITFD